MGARERPARLRGAPGKVQECEKLLSPALSLCIYVGERVVVHVLLSDECW